MEATTAVKERFCDSCDSKGFRHKKTCPVSSTVHRVGMVKGVITKEEDRVDLLAKKVDQLADILIPLAERVMSGEPKRTEAVPPPTVAESLTAVDEAENLSTQMIPKKWKDAVHEILGKGFDLQIDDAGHGNFSISIILPEGLDRRIPRDPKTRDRSTGLVRRASAEADVRHWCELVKKNIQKEKGEYKFVY